MLGLAREMLSSPTVRMPLQSSDRNFRRLGLNEVLHCDVIETENNFRIAAELPGVSQDYVKVLIDENVITIQAQAQQTMEEKDELGTYHIKERLSGNVERSFSLPSNADISQASCSFDDGVLEITFPKRVDLKSTARSLPISTKKDSPKTSQPMNNNAEPAESETEKVGKKANGKK